MTTFLEVAGGGVAWPDQIVRHAGKPLAGIVILTFCWISSLTQPYPDRGKTICMHMHQLPSKTWGSTYDHITSVMQQVQVASTFHWEWLVSRSRSTQREKILCLGACTFQNFACDYASKIELTVPLWTSTSILNPGTLYVYDCVYRSGGRILFRQVHRNVDTCACNRPLFSPWPGYEANQSCAQPPPSVRGMDMVKNDKILGP